jgi:hypothetical protein
MWRSSRRIMAGFRAAGDEGEGSACNYRMAPGPHPSDHRTRARIVSMATWTLKCDCSPAEILGNQPDESHVHVATCAPRAPKPPSITTAGSHAAQAASTATSIATDDRIWQNGSRHVTTPMQVIGFTWGGKRHGEAES